MITLHVDPKVGGAPWKDFLDTEYGIALDGYVYGKPWFNPKAPSANFNHHEEVDRLSTRATCSQVLIAVRQKLLDRFRKNGEIELNVYVNDCDQDVCLSWFILKNSWMCENTINPALNRLVHIEDMMDTCAGSYPFNKDLPIIEKVSWVFEPYTKFRLSGGLDKKNASDYRSVIEDVENRIMQHITNGGGVAKLDTRYEVMQSNDRWALIKEHGKDARTVLSGDGIKAFVSVRERPDKNWTYSVGKMSPFVDFDIQGILAALNSAEGNAVDMWGGSDTIGGSPRYAGSKLSPAQVADVINNYFKA
jgi:hypothetical protein